MREHRRRMGLVCLVATSLVALAVTVAPAVAATPVKVATSVSGRFLFFADPVTVRVSVLADRRLVDPSRVSFNADFGSWTQLARARTSSASAGPFVQRSWSFDIACLQLSCLPNGRPMIAHLPSLTIRVPRRDGSTMAIRHEWPAFSIAPRFGSLPPHGTPNFDLDESLPALTYRVDPTRLAFGLDVAAVLLTAFGCWLFLREGFLRRPARVSEIPPVASALSFVRQSKSRAIDDRRRAVGLLARTLADDQHLSLSDTAARVAWSSREPQPDRLEELAQMVEEAGERTA